MKPAVPAVVFLLALLTWVPAGWTAAAPRVDDCAQPSDILRPCLVRGVASAAPVHGETPLEGIPEEMRSLAVTKDAASAVPATRMGGPSSAQASGACPRDHGSFPVPGDCTDSLNLTDTDRQYSIVAPAGRTLVVRVTMTPESRDDWRACLSHVSQGSLCRTGLTGETVTLPTAVAQDATYSLRLVSHLSNATFRVSAAAHAWTLGDDCATGGDLSPEDALPLAEGGSCAGSLNPVDDLADGYSLALAPGEAATVRLQPNPEADFDMCARDGSGVVVSCALRPFGESDPLYLSPAAGGSFLLDPYVFNGAEGYTVTLEPAAPQDDCATGGDAGSRQRALRVPGPFACAGLLDPDAGDAWDVYALDLPAGGIRLGFDSGPDAYACLYPAADSWAVACVRGVDDVTYLAAGNESWLVAVYAYEAGAYGLRVDSFVPTPQDDCGSGTDAQDWRSTTHVPFEAPGSCAGALLADEGDLQDKLTYSLPESRMRVRIDASARIGYCVLGPVVGWCNNTDSRPEFTLETLGPGRWNVTLYGSEGAVSYVVRVDAWAPRDDCGTGGDGGSMRPSPKPRPLATPALHCKGALLLHSFDLTDAYSVDLLPGETLLVAFEGDVPDVQVCLRTTHGSRIACTGPPYVPGAPVTLETTRLQEERVVVTIDWVSGTRPAESAYDLTVVRTTDLARLVDAPLL